MNILKRSLAMFLTLCMLISLVPVTTFAAGTDSTETAVSESEEKATKTTAEQSSDFMKVFHLDCGRKYFTVAQVKELIDALSNVGFSHMELAIGNDGLRLLLDDMSVEANGTTYASDTVKSGIKSGNTAYSHAGEWSETEMNEIIAYAKSKGIEIIPLVNNPGHMDSILAAMEACGIDGYYKGSDRTVDLENDEAVAFTQALVMKYAEYFASKGCKYFNIGADEYANDYHTSDSTGMGFGYLIDNKMYGNFITYVNALVDDICNLGMAPIAFNDGIYFRENTSFGTFDTRLVVAAWTGGWGGIKPATTTFLQNKGHKILNTNERWYYVLGRKQAANSTYCYESALSNAKSESITTVTDHKTGINSIGAMQCVWCDAPSVNYETYKSNVMTLINTLAENNTDYFTGPNEVEPEEPVVPEEPEVVTKTDEKTNISVSAPGLTEVTITEVKDDAQLPEIEGAGEVKVYDVSPMAGEDAYTGEATITIPVPANWTKVRGGVLASEHGEEVLGIEGKLENGMFTFTVPHFSGVVTYAVNAVDAEEVIELELEFGETHEFTVENKDLRDEYSVAPEGVVDVDVTYTQVPGETERTLGNTVSMSSNKEYTGLIKSGNYYLVMNENGDISSTTDVNAATIFTVKRNSSSAYTISKGSKFLSVSSNTLTSSNNSYNWSFYSGFQYSYGTRTYRLVCSNGTWTLSTNGTRGNLYSYTETSTAPVNQSEVTFTALSVGETEVTIGDVKYKIVVKKAEKSVTVVVNGNNVFDDASNTDPVVGDSSIVDAVCNNGKLTITGKAVGMTTVTTDNAVYNITVIDLDPSMVTPLTVEYWITNIVTRTVESTPETPVTTQQINAGIPGIVTSEGADLNSMMPEWTIKRDGDSGADREVEFWQVRLLDKTQSNNSSSKTEEQTTEAADDETTNGDAVSRVRYHDPGDGDGLRWQLLAGDNWMDVDLEDNQIVAYYMEVVDLQNTNGTKELHVNAADWGKLGDNSPATSYADTSKYCSISLQIVYEDGSTNPAGTTANDLDGKTLIFNYWDAGRGIGTFAFDTLGQFDIYQITAETGAVSATFTGGAWGTVQVDRFTWDNNEKVVWSGESETASIYNNTSHPTSEDPKDNLMWNENKEAILIRVYVKAVETEDSLNVVYVDEKFNDTLYSYNVQVEAGHNFSNNMIGTPAALEGGRINVTGCGIENIYGQTQNFQTDLTKVPEAKGKYDSELYTYTGSEISEDGKTLYLYYNINTAVLKPNFVVDFGLPITFSLSEITKTPNLVRNVTASARYGNVDYDKSSKIFTYTPTGILPNIDVLSINIEFDGESTISTTNVGITPATTVHYEESFINWISGWSDGNKAIKVGNQTTETIGENKEYNYGYDPVYANVSGASNGTNATASAIGAKGTFTFTGNGVQVFANCTTESGYVAVQVANSSGKIVNLSMVDTVVDGGTTGATNGQTGNMYGLPIVSLVDLQNMAHDTYTVTITKIMDTEPVSIDGIRVFNTIKDSSIFKADLEDNPDFYEMRDVVLHAIGVKEDTSVDYKKMYEQVYDKYADVDEEGKGHALITDESVSYGDSSTIQDLLDNGPKNEIFLYKGQTLSFKVSTNRVMQLGMKAPQGATSVSIDVNGNTKEMNIGSSVDMFYTLANKATSVTEYTVNITNNDSAILSITELKVCDDPNFKFEELTKEDIKNILTDGEEPVEPEIEYADATLNIAIKDGNGKVVATTALTENGEVGKEAVFTKAAIKKAVEAAVPANYKLKTTAFKDVKVAFGEKADANFKVAKLATATLKVVLKDAKGKVLATKKLTAKGESGNTATFTAAAIKKAATGALPKDYKLKTTVFTAKKVVYGKTATVNIKAEKKLYTATLKVVVKNSKGKVLATKIITAKGESGKSKTFTKAEIKKAVKAMKLSKNYTVADTKIKAVKVNYGKTKTVTYKTKK